MLLADSLRFLGQSNEAIIWTDKALKVDLRLCPQLFTKLDPKYFLHYILKKVTHQKDWEKYTEALEVIEQCLKINPNHFDLLGGKGYCLQNQNQFEKAMLFYNKARVINSNDLCTINRKSILFLIILIR
ncbi:unnamed protein product [Paramecium octaurelia]|uniref:Tetratricopeptide repeat protein n=1 Tax=Paramecium octaurelia TaxID=43137 RepID=A0A8S1Y717_PAROT|nr:unnamed protein product [Paramecium octaurelia]